MEEDQGMEDGATCVYWAMGYDWMYGASHSSFSSSIVVETLGQSTLLGVLGLRHALEEGPVHSIASFSHVLARRLCHTHRRLLYCEHGRCVTLLIWLPRV